MKPIVAVDYAPGPLPSFADMRKRREAKRQQQQLIKERLRALDLRIKEVQTTQRLQRLQRQQRQQADQPGNASAEKASEAAPSPMCSASAAQAQAGNGSVQKAERSPIDNKTVAHGQPGQKPMPLPLMRHNPACPSFLLPPEKPHRQDPFSMTV